MITENGESHHRGCELVSSDNITISDMMMHPEKKSYSHLFVERKARYYKLQNIAASFTSSIPNYKHGACHCTLLLSVKVQLDQFRIKKGSICLMFPDGLYPPQLNAEALVIVDNAQQDVQYWLHKVVKQFFFLRSFK